MSLVFAPERGTGSRISFGPFTVDAVRRTVWKNGTPVRLTLKCVELLLALLRSSGRTLSKEDLLQAAWHDAPASDATLAQHVFLLRRALEPHGEWIETVPQTGYRFSAVVPVEGAREDRAPAEFMRGAATFRALMTDQGLTSAIELYSLALALDPGNAPAYAGRAACRRLRAQFMYAEPLGSLAGAKRDSDSGLECDPRNPDVLVEAAYAAALHDRNMRAAHAFLQRAQAADPDHREAAVLAVSLALMQGDLAAALLALQGKPGPLHGAVLYLAGDYERAKAELAAQLHDPLVRLFHAACSLFMGDAGAARDGFASVYHEEVDVRYASQPNVRHYALAFSIFADARSGDEATARRHASSLLRLSAERYVSPMALAIAHAGLREADAAVSFAEEAVSRLDPWAAHIAVDPFLNELRGDPRFERLIGVVTGTAQ